MLIILFGVLSPAPYAHSRDSPLVRHHEPMPATLRFTGESKDMTLDELAQFVEAAKNAGIPGTAHVRADLSTTGKIKEIEVPVNGKP